MTSYSHQSPKDKKSIKLSRRLGKRLNLLEAKLFSVILLLMVFLALAIPFIDWLLNTKLSREIQWLRVLSGEISLTVAVFLIVGYLVIRVLVEMGESGEGTRSELERVHSRIDAITKEEAKRFDSFIAIFKELDERIYESEHTEIKVIGLSFLFTWPYLRAKIREEKLRNLHVKACIISPRVCKDRNITNDWGSSLGITGDIKDFMSDPYWSRAMKDKDITFEYKIYNILPMVHGYLINDEHLYIGYCWWDQNNSNFRLEIDNRPYHYFNIRSTLGGDNIRFFSGWFNYLYRVIGKDPEVPELTESRTQDEENTAIIPAAGISERFESESNVSPKCLNKVSGKTIIGRLIQQCINNNIRRIVVVVGHKAENVERHISELEKELHIENPVKIIKHNKYREFDNAYSVYKGLEDVNSSVIIVNADDVFEDDILKSIVDSNEISLVVDRNSGDLPDQMKVKIRGGEVIKIGKGLNQYETNGEFIGLCKIPSKYVGLFRNKLNELIKTSPSSYWDDGFNAVADEVPLWVVETKGKSWIEVDSAQDLKRAKEMFSRVN